MIFLVGIWVCFWPDVIFNTPPSRPNQRITTLLYGRKYAITQVYFFNTMANIILIQCLLVENALSAVLRFHHDVWKFSAYYKILMLVNWCNIQIRVLLKKSFAQDVTRLLGNQAKNELEIEKKIICHRATVLSSCSKKSSFLNPHQSESKFTTSKPLLL